MNYKGNKHLTLAKRQKIEALHRAGHSKREIAEQIGCCYSTVRNELARGMYVHHSGDFWKEEIRYAPERAHQEYRTRIKGHGKSLKILEHPELMEEIRKLLLDKNSPAVALMIVNREGSPYKGIVKSVNTIYGYIRRGIFEYHICRKKRLKRLYGCDRMLKPLSLFGAHGNMQWLRAGAGKR